LELATMALLQLTPALCSTVGARNDGAATTCCGIVATHNVATLWHAAVARNVATLRHVAAARNIATLWCYGAAIHVVATMAGGA